MKINRSIPSLIKHLRPIPLYFIVGNESFYHCEKNLCEFSNNIEIKSINKHKSIGKK